MAINLEETEMNNWKEREKLVIDFSLEGKLGAWG